MGRGMDHPAQLDVRRMAAGPRWQQSATKLANLEAGARGEQLKRSPKRKREARPSLACASGLRSERDELAQEKRRHPGRQGQQDNRRQTELATTRSWTGR